ncbi:MAG: Wzz/FepE/Etk N-terminal domain-containing protein, partial [Nitrospinales bacterium]
MIPGRDLEGVDVGDYLRIIAKRKYTLINCVAFCVLVAIIYAFNATPIFQASVRILIERKTPKAVSIDEIMTVDTSR